MQIIKWILDSLGLGNIIGDSLIFLLSSIFTLIIIIALIVNQNYKEIKKIKDFLKANGFTDEERKMVDKLNKKAEIDPRILWIIIALIFLYLLSKIFFTYI